MQNLRCQLKNRSRGTWFLKKFRKRDSKNFEGLYILLYLINIFYLLYFIAINF